MALLLLTGASSVFCVNSVYASFFDGYEFVNCPDGLLYNPEIALCEWPSGESSEDDYVCVVIVKRLGIDITVFACAPETKKPNCRAVYEGITLICNDAKKVIDKISK